MRVTKILKAIRDCIKKVIDKIRKSKAIDKGEELLLTAVLPVIISEVTGGQFKITTDQSNKYAKEIVNGLNKVGDMVWGADTAATDIDALNGLYPNFDKLKGYEND